MLGCLLLLLCQSHQIVIDPRRGHRLSRSSRPGGSISPSSASACELQIRSRKPSCFLSAHSLADPINTIRASTFKPAHPGKSVTSLRVDFQRVSGCRFFGAEREPAKRSAPEVRDIDTIPDRFEATQINLEPPCANAAPESPGRYPGASPFSAGSGHSAGKPAGRDARPRQPG